MGIFGLSSFVAQHETEFFDDFKLFSCVVLIDGNSAASVIYSNLTKSNHAFGGDYDKFVRSIRDFIQLLEKCDVIPIFIFDGGYETRKLQTVLDRVQKNIIICGQYKKKYRESKTFPLLLRDVFRASLCSLEVSVVQCDFEADKELVILSHLLNCPLISYDSDFYFTDSSYIPFTTIDFRAVKFKTKLPRGKYYIPCKIFNPSSFFNRFGCCLNKSMLPLLSCALGNDYVPPNSFKNFLQLNRIVKFEERMAKIIHWMAKISSIDEAVEQMLSCLPKNRNSIKKKIISLLSDYNRRTSDLLEYIPKELVGNVFKNELNSCFVHMEKRRSNVDSLKLPSFESEISFTDDEETFHRPPSEDDDVIVLEAEEYEIYDRDLDADESTNKMSNYCVHELKGDKLDYSSQSEITEITDKNIYSINAEFMAPNYSSQYEVGFENSVIEETKSDNDYCQAPFRSQVPRWFFEKYRRGIITPNLVNIINFQRLFIPSQSEDYFSKPSHEICLPVLEFIIGIIFGRNSSVSQVKCYARYKRMQLGTYNIIPAFEVNGKPLPSLSAVVDVPPEERSTILMNCLGVPEHLNLKLFPKEWQLFIIILIFWKKNCKQPVVNNSHIRAIIVCLIYLNVIDCKVGFARSASDLKRIIKEKNQVAKLMPCVETEYQPVNGKESLSVECEYSIDDYINLISNEDCFRSAKVLLTYHQVNQSLLTNRENFNLKVVHSFAQLQHCIQSISILNSVLNFPFLPCTMHLCFSGTFLYNFYSELNERKLSDGYITRTLLSKAPSIITLYRYLISSWDTVTNVKETRPKFEIKAKKKKITPTSQTEQLNSIDEAEHFYDPGNIYSVLTEE